MNPADIAFIIICTGLVMLMTPGLALFYGGLVRSRNVLSTTMHSFITMALYRYCGSLWGIRLLLVQTSAGS